FVRLMLVSGGYAYCQMMGTALLAVPIGVGLREAVEYHLEHRFVPALLAFGSGLSVAGGGGGSGAGGDGPGRGTPRRAPTAGPGVVLPPLWRVDSRRTRRPGAVDPVALATPAGGVRAGPVRASLTSPLHGPRVHPAGPRTCRPNRPAPGRVASGLAVPRVRAVLRTRPVLAAPAE